MPLTTTVLEAGVAARQAGGLYPAWVSGVLAGLAASATTTVWFDLGPDWVYLKTVQIMLAPAASSGLSSIQAFSSDDSATVNTARRLKDVNATGPATGLINAILTSDGTTTITVRPAGRYLAVRMTNADIVTAVGAGAKITLSLHGI